MCTEVDEKLKEVKQSFRLMMDGAVAASMRSKGIDYHINWGATLPRLRTKADELGKDYGLAVALWKEDVRECRLLATMVMPHEKMAADLAELWMEQTRTIEEAEQLAFNLFQHLSFIPDLAFRWIASSETLPQICGYHVLSRLFMRGLQPNERAVNEFVDQAVAAMRDPSPTLRKAAHQSLQHFGNLSIMHRRLADSAMRIVIS